MECIDPRLFQSFSEAMPLGVCFVDLQGTIIYWNTAAEEITGYLRHEVQGRRYREDLLIRGTDMRLQCPVREVLRDGQTVAADLFLRHKDGHRIAVHVFAFPLCDSQGEMTGVGEVLDAAPGKPASSGCTGRPALESESATGLPGVEESAEQLQTLLRSRMVSSSVLILIEISEQQAILRHGGTAMLHQALRVVARMITGLLPSRTYVGCWSDWRLMAIVPECRPETLEKLKSNLAGVGSSCAVKWWGDRVIVRIRAAANYVEPLHKADGLMQGLEQELKSATAGKE